MVLDEVSAFWERDAPHLNEADTKAHFVEPLFAALGWSGLGVVRREYFVRHSQEYLDYVMMGPSGPLLAVEAKALHVALTEKHAAQVVQYCGVEGIEWAALTNGRQLQFFNVFLRPDLAAKRLFALDLLGLGDDATFADLFSQLWLLSRESLTNPTHLRTWMQDRLLDRSLRKVLAVPHAAVVAALCNVLHDEGVSAAPDDVARWMVRHLTNHSERAISGGALPVPPAEQRALPSPMAVTPRHATEVVPPRPPSQVSEDAPDLRAKAPRTVAASSAAGVTRPRLPVATTIKRGRGGHPHTVYQGTLRDLLDAGLVKAGTTLELEGRGREVVAKARLTEDGEIEWNGKAYRSPSDPAFAAHLGRARFNGWERWYAVTAQGREQLLSIRARYSGETPRWARDSASN